MYKEDNWDGGIPFCLPRIIHSTSLYRRFNDNSQLQPCDQNLGRHQGWDYETATWWFQEFHTSHPILGQSTSTHSMVIGSRCLCYLCGYIAGICPRHSSELGKWLREATEHLQHQRTSPVGCDQLLLTFKCLSHIWWIVPTRNVDFTFFIKQVEKIKLFSDDFRTFKRPSTYSTSERFICYRSGFSIIFKCAQ